MKKILCSFFSVMLAFSMAACSGVETVQEETENPVVTEMQAALQSYSPQLDADAAIAEGMFVIQNGTVIGGEENWNAFFAEEAEELVICQFTKSGGAMLDYVARQADGSYVVVSDLSRDGYDYEEKEEQTIQYFKEMKVFENFSVEKGTTPHTICVMTNDKKLNADTFRTYWKELSYEKNGAFLLFVI